MSIDMLEVEELACKIFGIDIDNENYEELIDEELEEYGIHIEEFSWIIEKLLPFSRIVQSELTGERYYSFGEQISDTMFKSIVKIKIEQ